jgi:rod shape-determining protein MreC
MEFFLRFKNALVLIAVLLVQTIALAMQVRSPVDASEPDGPQVRLLRLWATATVTPFERVAHAFGSSVRSGWSDYIGLRSVRKENKQLQEQVARMRIDQAALSEDALEGRRLQALLGFRERFVGKTVVAEVIGASGTDRSRMLTIDKGWHDGLKPDMAVITPDGIVGKLRDVFPDTSQVLEINDQTSGAGVLLASTRIRAILRGTATGGTQIGNLMADSRIKPGEAVVTSGGDQVYPRGLPVGTIESIAPDPDHQPYTAIVVRPAVKLERVEEVLVVTETQGDLPAQTQQDLAAADAARPADAGAERLPGIDEPAEPQAAAGAAAGGPTPPVVLPTVPRPLPAVHPDRFSTGATPPAAAMTPGAAHAGAAAKGGEPKAGETKAGESKAGEPAGGSQGAAEPEGAPVKPSGPIAPQEPGAPQG